MIHWRNVCSVLSHCCVKFCSTASCALVAGRAECTSSCETPHVPRLWNSCLGGFCNVLEASRVQGPCPRAGKVRKLCTNISYIAVKMVYHDLHWPWAYSSFRSCTSHWVARLTSVLEVWLYSGLGAS